MDSGLPRELTVIAGKGVYPCLLAKSARKQGVQRLCAVAFRGETERALAALVDELQWLHLGQLGALLESLKSFGVRHAVMAGQITPTHLFRLRMDARMLGLLARLRERNAETIFGAISEEMKGVGVELLHASSFMEDTMPEAGLIAAREPTEEEWADIRLGLKVAKTTSGLEIGQTVVVKNGTILAVEAFEGTDAAILRAGELGGPGCAVVKVAKRGHDMRFDIPVIGERTMKSLAKARAAVLAVEAGRTILLDREALKQQADRMKLSFVAVRIDDDSAETGKP